MECRLLAGAVSRIGLFAKKLQFDGGIMKLRVLLSLCAFSISMAFGAVAQAQERAIADVSAGYSYVRYNPGTFGFKSFSMNGGSASAAYNINGWLSGVADFGGYSKHNILGNGVSGTLSTYLFGPRVSVRHFGRVTPFAEALFGVAHVGRNFLSTGRGQTPFAMTVGGGLDYRVTSHFGIRAGQVDYLLTRFSEVSNTNQKTQDNLRVTSGLVFRF